MRFFLLTSLLALISTTLAVSTPRAGGVAKLRQATRAQIVRRMQGRQGLGRRQSLPSAGVYPTCPDSEPNSAGSSVTAYAKFIQIRVSLCLNYLTWDMFRTTAEDTRPFPVLIRIMSTRCCRQSMTTPRKTAVQAASALVCDHPSFPTVPCLMTCQSCFAAHTVQPVVQDLLSPTAYPSAPMLSIAFCTVHIQARYPNRMLHPRTLAILAPSWLR